MKKLICMGLLAASIFCCTGCHSAVSDHDVVTFRLEPNRKLKDVAWREYKLWYLTRPMREDEYPEIYTFDMANTPKLLLPWNNAAYSITIIESKEE